MTTALLIAACKECGEFVRHRNACSWWSKWMHGKKAGKKRMREFDVLMKRAIADGFVIE